jgi:hypothetical protein
MSGDIPPLPQYAFMVWCSVKKEKHRESFTLFTVVGKMAETIKRNGLIYLLS